MATSYKYIAREAEDQINWAEVGANLTNTLKEENRVREEKKGAIDAASREYSNILNNVEQGQNTELNKFALNSAADLQEKSLIDLSLLKSGDLSQRQYTIMKQNMTDGTNQAFSLFENYNKENDRKIAMINSELPVGEQASGLQNALMTEIEGFGNFMNTKLIIDPNTNLMSMAKMIPDPKYKGSGEAPLIPDMNNLMSVQSMENRIKGTYTQFDVLGSADSYIKSLGENKTIELTKLGNAYTKTQFKTISDVRNKTGKKLTDAELQQLSESMGMPKEDIAAISLFSASQNAYAKSRVGVGGLEASSVLTDHAKTNPLTGEPYEIALESPEIRKRIEDGDTNIVLFKSENGRMVAELTEDQQVYAEKVLKDAIDIGLDYSETSANEFMTKTPPRKSKDDNDRDDLAKLQGDVMNNVGKIFSGDNAQVDEAINFIRSTNKSIKSIDRKPNGVEIIMKNGDKEFIDFMDGDNPLPKRGWVEGNANFFLDGNSQIKDVNSVYNRSKAGENDVFNAESTGYSAGTVAAKENNNRENANIYVNSTIVPSSGLGINQTDDNFKNAFDSKYGSLGFRTEIPNNPQNKVYIYAKGNPEPFTMFTMFEGKEAKDKQSELRDWVTGNMTDENVDQWAKTKVGTKSDVQASVDKLEADKAEKARLKKEAEDKAKGKTSNLNAETYTGKN
jgi:hypothetical protein